MCCCRVPPPPSKLPIPDLYLYCCVSHECFNGFNHQELEDQRRKDTSEREKVESWKEEERKKFKEEMRDLKQLFLQEFRDMASRSSSIEAVSPIPILKDMHEPGA